MPDSPRKLTWLHLSDLHYCEPKTGWDAAEVLDNLLEDLRELEKTEGLRPDLIFFTGDLAMGNIKANPGWNLEDQYAGAGKFLDSVRAAFSPEIPRSRVFISPGNHDIDRKMVGRGTAMLLDSFKSQEEILPIIRDKDRDWEDCMRRLESFRAFLKSAGYGHFLHDDPDRLLFGVKVEINGLCVGVGGLNSAWSCCREDEKGKLWMGAEWQIKTVSSKLKGADLSILMSHHPPEWFKGEEDPYMKKAIPERFDFFLHGHEHDEWLFPYGGRHAKISAGACYRNAAKGSGYNIVQWDHESRTARVWFRKYSDDGSGGWVPMHVRGKTDRDGVWTIRLVESEADKKGGRTPTAKWEIDRAEADYLDFLEKSHKYLNFKGMGTNDRVPLRISLADLYVPLEARIEMPEGECWARELKLAGRTPSPQEAECMGERLSGPALASELLNRHDGLVVLGDPGAGKTTFIKYLALREAASEKRERMPVLIPLSAYANALAERDNISLGQFMENYYRDLLDAPVPMGEILRRALDAGKALVLMDGLDEVQSLEGRMLVVGRVENFFNYHRKKGNKFVVTSRIVGYREARPSAEGLAECTLVDFGEKEIEAFVKNWTKAMEKAAVDSDALSAREAKRQEEELMLAVKNNPGVAGLASNPLLLTILALMKRQGVALPERRVELYHRYTEVLLKQWNLARGLDRPYATGLDLVETVNVLAPLALWMHETSPGVGLVRKADILNRLTEIYRERGERQPERAAETFLKDVRTHTALLLERGQGMYGFIHLTFQEYLAAVGLAQKGQLNIEKMVEVLAEHVGDPTWVEVTRLAVAHLGINQYQNRRASEILEKLLSLGPEKVGEAAVLAGRTVRDAWPEGVTRQCRDKVIEALVNAVRGKLPGKAKTRAAAGVVLGKIGDIRLEITTLDKMEFCLVPGGDFVMSEKDDAKEICTCLQNPFWMGRFPVTNAQYRFFVDAGGYAEEKFWDEAVRHGVWKEGNVKGRFDSEPRNHPYRFGDPFGLPNHPVVGVTWYEAMAFARWLVTDWRRRRVIPEDWRVGLPSEAEWEKAARGGLEVPQQPAVLKVDEIANCGASRALIDNESATRKYPWGDDFDPEKTNMKDSDIGTTSTPGCFFSGKSSCGCEDMSGNAWEWTRSKRNTYPYDPADGREEAGRFGKSTWISLRGGAFYSDDKEDTRCGFRISSDPNLLNGNFGFRILLSPPLPLNSDPSEL